MKILVVGSGGREHAVIKKLKESRYNPQIYSAPGGGGGQKDSIPVDIKATDIEKMVDFSIKEKIDLVCVTPDDPLVLGMVDELNKAGIRAFGPSKAAARIEGSKSFAKELMVNNNIPTAKYKSFTDFNQALKYLQQQDKFPQVIKADGLALGKGVVIAENYNQAKDALSEIMLDKKFGNSGNTVVIEEFLTGPEISVLCFCDGETIKPMVSSMDHKRSLDNDLGENTGGMGTVAPNPFYTKETEEECFKNIFIPTVKAMKDMGNPFKGVLYFGLMKTDNGVKVIEYNCRFGDPETQVCLPLLEGDLVDIMNACIDGTLSKTEVNIKPKSAACVIIASGGYPKAYEKGKPIKGLDAVENLKDIEVFHAGTKLLNGKFYTNGGRVLGVESVGENLADALSNAYSAVDKISFDKMFFRKDIGRKALKEEKK